MRIIEPRTRMDFAKFVVYFDPIVPGVQGYAFDGTEHGNIFITGANRESAIYVGNHLAEYTKRVVDYSGTYISPAVGECGVCFTPVTLSGFTNTCEHCGADYNQSGQRLAPREQWGDEGTGETLADILRIP